MKEVLGAIKDFEKDVRNTTVEQIQDKQCEIPEGFQEYLEQKRNNEIQRGNIEEKEDFDELSK